MTYNEMYANAIAQLGETYLTPAYAQARENFFKVFETLAAAGCMGRVEDCRPELDNPEYIADEEEVSGKTKALPKRPLPRKPLK